MQPFWLLLLDHRVRPVMLVCGRQRPHPGAESNVSDQTPVSERRNPRSLMSRGVACYLIALTVLTCIAFVPNAITVGVMLFVLPGLMLLVSVTLLAYSIALLPAYLVNRHLGRPSMAAAAAVLGVVAVALLPHAIDRYMLGRLVASDFSGLPSSFRPRSFELPYLDEDRYWTTWRGQSLIRPPPPCADLCQQLLFKGNVDQVVVFGDASEDPLAKGSIVFAGGKAYFIPGGSKRSFRAVDLANDKSVQEIPVERAQDPSRFFKQRWRRFRLQQHETCPATLSIIAAGFAQDVAAGRCLIEDIVDSADADVVLTISEAPPPPPRGPGPHTDACHGLAYRGIQDGPVTVTIAERRENKLVPVEMKTTLEARYAALPFYFGVRSMGGEIASLCLGVVTDPFPPSHADPFEMISRRYGLPIARTVGAAARPLLSR
jgi:hypothetical protein